MFVCDSDRDVILGTCAVHGMHIPHLYAHVSTLAQGNVPERRRMSLRLFKQRESATLKEILIRLEAGDQDVTQFVKANKRLFDTEQIRKKSIL